MPLPRAGEARPFYRAAKQRYDDAELLLRAGRTTGAVYLAGYTVACMLRALILDKTGSGLRRNLLGEFRGSRAHNVEWLTDLYRRHIGPLIPRDIARHLARLTWWSTDLRLRHRNPEQTESGPIPEIGGCYYHVGRRENVKWRLS
jgi:HEPN domain-containing protein